MSGSRLFQSLLLFGLGPIGKHLASKFLNLFNGHSFRFIGGSTLGNSLIHLVGYLLQ